MKRKVSGDRRHYFKFLGRRWSLFKRSAESVAKWEIDFILDGHRVKKSLKTSQVKVAQERASKLYIQPAMYGEWWKVFPSAESAALPEPAVLAQEMVDCLEAAAARARTLARLLSPASRGELPGNTSVGNVGGKL